MGPSLLTILVRLSKPNQSPTTRPKRLTPTRFWPKPKVQSVGSGTPFSRTDIDGLSGEFPFPKREPLEPDWSYIQSPAKSD